MRILIITQIFLPEMGALANRMYPFVRELVNQGHDVVVATGMPNYPAGVVFKEYQGKKTMSEKMEGFTVERTAYYTAPRNQSKKSQLRSYLSFLPAVYRSGKRAGRCDVVFVTSPPIFPAVPAMMLAKKWKAKLVFDIRDLWPDEIVAVGAAKEGSKAVEMVRRVERKVYKMADIVSCTTHAFIDTVCSRGVDRKKTILTPNGADLAIFHPREKFNEHVEEYGLGDRFVVMYSGLLGIKHGLETILEAAKHLQDEKGIVFFMRGNGPRKEALFDQAKEMGLDNVVFGGEKPMETLPYLISRADVCVTNLLPDAYLEKIISVKIFEYMACEKPVVAALAGESAKVITDADAGFVVPAGDGKAMADAIRKLYKDRELCEAMGKRGRKHVEENYSRELIAKRLAETLGQLASK
ncbi:glycosyltransferase WbuB [bacterium]|nr:MAG: glycosyltransferase WbuB [bacterium]